jgi:hypothetical protein
MTTVARVIGNVQRNVALEQLIEQQHSDGVVATVGATILDETLKSAMILRFRSSAGHRIDMNERLFRPGGPLGFLVPKIDLSYQMFMFEKPIRNAMYGIADIQNLFSHEPGADFESADPRMTDAAKKLTLHHGRMYYPNPMTGEDHLEAPIVETTNTLRERFFVNLKFCLLWLMGDSGRHHHHTNAPLTFFYEQSDAHHEMREPRQPAIVANAGNGFRP